MMYSEGVKPINTRFFFETADYVVDNEDELVVGVGYDPFHGPGVWRTKKICLDILDFKRWEVLKIHKDEKVWEYTRVEFMDGKVRGLKIRIEDLTKLYESVTGDTVLSATEALKNINNNDNR